MSLDSKNRSNGNFVLYDQITLARFWLPVVIVLVVLLFHLAILNFLAEDFRTTANILFYSILGPTATFLTLSWIASEIVKHEKDRKELEFLYVELQSGHELLSSILEVTEQFASAPNLESTITVAARGITDVTRARGVAICLEEGNTNITDHYNLNSKTLNEAIKRTSKLANNQALDEKVDIGDKICWVLTSPLLWAEKLVGGVHAYFEMEPTAEQRESFAILSSEFSAAAEATHGRTRDLLTLFEVDRSIRAEQNLERILETLLKQMMARANASIGGVYLLDDSKVLLLRAWRGTKANNASSLKLGEGFIGMAAIEQKPRFSPKLKQDYRQTVLEHAQSAIALPLISNGLLGVVVLAHKSENHFDENSLPFLNLVAGQLTQAVRNAQSYLQSEELAVAEERRRIAREIHDGIAQTLASSALKLDLVSKLMEKNKLEQAIKELASTKITLRELIKELRRSIFALRPVDLESYGLAETVRRYCVDYGEQNDVNVVLKIDDVPKFEKKLEIAIFRIFQEAMHNIAKHSKAKNIEVTIYCGEKHRVCLKIVDDGIGFDPLTVSDRVTSAGGLGLKQMKERMERLGGKFSIESELSRGTTVKASVPI